MWLCRQLSMCVVAVSACWMIATPAQAARKAFHVTGHLNVVPDPDFGPYATSDFDAVFVYETELDHPAVADAGDIPATAHAVEVLVPPFSGISSSGSSYLFKTYPVPDEHMPDPLGFPDPAGYSGISFIRAHAPGFEQDEMGNYIPEDVVYARSRRGNSAGRPTSAFGMGVLDNTPGSPDLIGILDHMRVTNANSIAGSVATESGRFSMFFAHHDGTLLTDTGTGIFPDSGNDLPPTLATPAVISPNGPWGFSAWEGTAGYSASPAIVIEELMFGDIDLDGDVDGDDEAIFQANLDNDRDGLADDGGAFVYEVDEIPDLIDTIDIDETQPIGFATWLLGDFNLDGFVTDADGAVFDTALPGDGNDDGWVDGLDYLIWAANFGSHPGPGTGPGNGDYNDDGWVDGLDYLEWAGNFGTHAASAVPEPNTLTLLLLAATGGLCRRRQRDRTGSR